MFKINKVTSNTTVDFAAEELKKYLRMMMPRCGEIPVIYAPGAKDGFRLGLMSDLGLDMSDAEDSTLDDIIYINTAANGGIISGSNPGATLIAVYRYLRFQGCRWLFPGIDGEYIPIIKDVKSVCYRKMADHRYRGQCNEGAEFQQNMLETIDFTPKIGMNTYMIEFDIPYVYYRRYYEHHGNSVRESESVTYEQVLQWKRQCEVEIKKRGLHFHDMGHGWTAEPFGFDSAVRTIPENISDDTRKHLAMLDGRRKFHIGGPIDTNVCMSNSDTRRIMVNYIADYAETQNNVDFLHVWLADATNNHCECEACKKKTVSDWYVILLNEIDAELTRRNLSTHIVFIAYIETFWAPIEERLNNRKRFTMLYAPITRRYTETYGEPHDTSQVRPFKLNDNEKPRGMGACLAYLDEWKKHWKGDCFCYEYHFWRQETYDPGYMHLSKLLYDDICALKKNGLDGMVEDGSQRSYFPTGFPFYVYAETLYDSECSYEDLKKDYFMHAYGKDGMKAAKYLDKISSIIGNEYLAGENKIQDAEFAVKLEEIDRVVAEFVPIIQANKNQTVRVWTVAWRLLDYHKDYILELTHAMKQKALGNEIAAKKIFDELMDEFSKREIYIERYYDHYQRQNVLGRFFNNIQVGITE